jgi:hypothetical protein
MRFARVAWLFVAAPLAAQTSTDGQWFLERGDATAIRLTIRIGDDRFQDSWSSEDVPARQIVGLPDSAWRSAGIPAQFRLVRDAGTLVCEGWFAHGKGSGHFSYSPSREFVAELARRGIDPPSARAQLQMTMADLGLDLVDELAREGYRRPTADELARMATNEVDREYLQGLNHAGYRLGDPAPLVRMRDHGVDPEFTD